MRRIAMNAPAHIRYAQRPDATPEAELSALAAVYRFVLDCRAKKEAATSPVNRPNDAERSLYVPKNTR